MSFRIRGRFDGGHVRVVILRKETLNQSMNVEWNPIRLRRMICTINEMVR